jgi:flagellar biosynthesis protein
VFVHESKELVALLMDVDLDRQIPPTLYRVIAELLAWLYHIESMQHPGGTLPSPPKLATDNKQLERAAETDAREH